MRIRTLGAAFAAVAFVLLAVPARADVVDLTDGKDKIRLPKDVESPWGTVPSDAELDKSGRGNLDLAYDESSLSRTKIDSAQIVYVYITEAYANEAFNNGEKYGVQRFWRESAQAFGVAAQQLDGAARQWALYKRMLATANTNDKNATLQAANDLLGSAEKTYYMGPAQEMRARIYASAGKTKEAVESLQKVIDAPGMNVRDYFNAKYLQTWLTKSVGADSAAKWQAAEKAYRDLLTELERNSRRQLALVPKFKIEMSLGEALRAQGNTQEARKIFDSILADANDATDKGVLAGVYYGLGDLVFDEASKLQSGGASGNKEKIQELLDQAALHYLRVILLYKEYADTREVFGATRGAARVFRAIFQVSGEKDCEAARRAYDYYRDAVGMMDQGEERRLLVSEGLALQDRIKQVCDVPSETPEGEEE